MQDICFNYWNVCIWEFVQADETLLRDALKRIDVTKMCIRTKKRSSIDSMLASLG